MILLKRVDLDIEEVKRDAQRRDFSEEERHALLALYNEFEVGKFVECRNRMGAWPREWWEFVDQSVWTVLHDISHGDIYITMEQLQDPDKGWV